jgi:uncharacterized membrane-anchored protein YhcB (DUF1043 family)
MNTRDIVLVGAGVVVGYLLVGFLNKSKDNAQETMDSVEPIVDQTKIDACNKQVADFMATAKFSSNVDLEKMKKDIFDSCMAQKA